MDRSNRIMDMISTEEIASRIDYTNLKANINLADVERLCKESIENHFAAVCIPPVFISDAVKWLEGSPVKVATVVGFPMGYGATSAKVEGIKNAADKEADEVDVVMNIAAVKNGRWAFARNDIEAMATTAHLNNKIIKVIIEIGLLTPEEIEKVCEICVDADVDYVKTSTGFLGRGASVEDIEQLRALLPPSIKIKASGGIKSRAAAEALIRAGADRIGASAALDLIA